MNYAKIREDMKKKRHTKHWTKKDVESILTAQETGDWSTVHTSKLYNEYSGEYCSLLEVLAKRAE